MIAQSGDISLPSFPTFPGQRQSSAPVGAERGEHVDDAWSLAIDAALTWFAAGGAPPTTLRLRRYQLSTLARSVRCGPWDVQLSDLLRLLANPAWSPETRKSYRSSVRAFYRFGVDTGQVSDNPATLLPTIRIPRAEPRPVPEGQVVRAMAMAANPRDRMMVLFGRYMGLRRSEIAKIHSDDFDGDVLYVQGKGGVVRRVPVPAELLELLPDRTGYVFVGRIDGHLSPDTVGRILKRLLGSYSGHQLRHSFFSTAHGRGADLLTLTRLGGWSKTDTAQRYTLTPDQALRAAVLAAST